MRVLDVCCGSRMFWFEKSDSRAIFMDKRVESCVLNDSSKKSGKRNLVVRPDVQADFTALPFPSNYFSTVVFDPPHLNRLGKSSWMAKKYGRLEVGWESVLATGFSECFRVLKTDGTLVFKWNEDQIPVSEIMELAGMKPLFGHRSGKHSKTHWICFVKAERITE